MSIFNDGTFPAIWAKIGGFIHKDVEPALEIFFKQFASDEGKLILTTGFKYAPQLASGNFGAVSTVAAAELIAGSAVIAKQDLNVTLQQVQSALQIAKVANAMTTPADQVIIANIAADNKTAAGNS